MIARALALLVLFAAVVVALIIAALLGNARCLWWNTSSMTREQKRAHYRALTHFYHVQFESSSNANEGLSEAAFKVDSHLSAKRHFSFQFRGNRIASGLPLPTACAKNLVVLHIHGSWSNLCPNTPWLNEWIGGHAKAVRDTVGSLSRLQLPYPIIGFRMPTEPLGTVNFGQEDDNLAISDAFERVCNHLPAARVVVMGSCLGALRVINWVNGYHNKGLLGARLAGVVLESPLPSLRRFVSVSRFEIVNRILYQLFLVTIANFQSEPHRIDGKRIPLPALIGVLADDHLCTPSDISTLVSRFPKSAVLVAEHGAQDSLKRPVRHGHMSQWAPFNSALRTFLATAENQSSSAQSK